MTTCTRQRCGISGSEQFNGAMFAYNTNIATAIRPNATCVGSGSGLGVNCSSYTYGGPRRTIASIGDPVLINRAYNSSACTAPEFNTMVDTLSQPIQYTPEQVAALNKGIGLSSWHTRQFASNSAIQERNISAWSLTKPNQWSDGYQGRSPIDAMNTPTRQTALCHANSKYRQFADTGISRNSYGSYGVSCAR